MAPMVSQFAGFGTTIAFLASMQGQSTGPIQRDAMGDRFEEPELDSPASRDRRSARRAQRADRRCYRLHVDDELHHAGHACTDRGSRSDAGARTSSGASRDERARCCGSRSRPHHGGPICCRRQDRRRVQLHRPLPPVRSARPTLSQGQSQGDRRRHGLERRPVIGSEGRCGCLLRAVTSFCAPPSRSRPCRGAAPFVSATI